MKKLFTLFVSMMLATVLFAGQAKYVFYFIGDGMGPAEVQGTEYYLSQIKGELGITPLCFTSFPYAGFVTTFSANSDVTDSSAAGTALACGVKINNGALGILPDSGDPVNSVAVWAKASGKSVGITTSVGVNHATPAAFYGHRPSRNDYYEIGVQLAQSGFDFFAGGDFINPTKEGEPSLYQLAEEAGYTILRGYDDYKAKKNTNKPMILLQKEGIGSDIPYAVDAREGDLTLDQIVTAAIEQLSKNKKGFFLMCEGGQIDHGGHANDAIACLGDVVSMDDAVKVAYEFYKKHPNETLIVVTADHETGGLALTGGGYSLNTGVLQYQKVSKHGFSQVLNKMRHEKKDKVEWADVKAALTENFGFWKEVQLTHDDEMKLYDEWYHSFAANEKVKMAESLYFKDEPLSHLAVTILNRIARLSWPVGSHSGSYVPVFAVGAGAEQFTGRIDNTDIPKKIAKVAGYKVKK
ncbi:MAG: alkaline phosphatase [Bacteroidaceae bacterium]|nr:alkaline phosphatase [Bacteroidaceae bacterium]